MRTDSITHDITGKLTGASVLLKKAPEGTGIIAGGPARNVCELAGIKEHPVQNLWDLTTSRTLYLLQSML